MIVDEVNADGIHINWERIYGELNKALFPLTPEMVHVIHRTLTPYIQIAEQEARRAAQEECVRVCDAIAGKWSMIHSVAPVAAYECGEAIRRLIDDSTTTLMRPVEGEGGGR